MLKDITFGQFFPGRSPLHKADPRMKIVLTVLFIVAVFLANSASGYALTVAATVALVAVSRIPLKMILKGMKPLLFIIIFTAIINVFWTKGDKALVDFYFIHIYPEGIAFAAMMILRITALLAGTSVLLTYTTSPIMLTDGIEQLLRPLRVLHIPVHEFAMMMTIALRFIPTLIEETDKIMSAQKARGADFTSGNLVKRAKALIPILIPLFVSSFRRADELAVAMECRCYRGDGKRTKMHVLKTSAVDWLLLAAFAVIMAGIVCLNIFYPIYKF